MEFYPTSYGFSIGTWLVLDQQTARGGDGAFGYNLRHGFGAITDGQSNTLCAADVKAFTAALMDGGQPAAPNTPPPATPAQMAAYGGTFDPDYCHTQWVTGRTLQSGLTTTFPPNTVVPYTTGGVTYDVDFTSARVGPGTPPAELPHRDRTQLPPRRGECPVPGRVSAVCHQRHRTSHLAGTRDPGRR